MVSILEKVALRKEVLNEKFSAEQQDLLKKKIVKTFSNTVEECRNYEKNRGVEGYYDNIQEVPPAQDIDSGIKAMAKVLLHAQIVSTPLYQMEKKVESVMQQDNPHLYDVIETVVDSIKHYNTPLACQEAFGSIQKYTESLLFKHKDSMYFAGCNFDCIYNRLDEVMQQN